MIHAEVASAGDTMNNNIVQQIISMWPQVWRIWFYWNWK